MMIGASLDIQNIQVDIETETKTGYMVVINSYPELWYYAYFNKIEDAQKCIEETGRDDLFIVKI